jgi:hypothetical protein
MGERSPGSSSAFSGTDSSADYVSSVVSKVNEQFFLKTTTFSISEAQGPIDAIHYVTSKQRHLFCTATGEESALLGETVDALFRFGLRSGVVRWGGAGEDSGGRLRTTFMELMENTISIYRSHLHDRIFDGILDSIERCLARTSFLLPSGEQFTPYDPDAATEFLLTVVARLISLFPPPERVLTTLFQCHVAGNPALRNLVYVCAAKILPSGISAAVDFVSFCSEFCTTCTTATSTWRRTPPSTDSSRPGCGAQFWRSPRSIVSCSPANSRRICRV